MRNTLKAAPLGNIGERSLLVDAFGQLRRTLALAADRRHVRPLQDIDGWSDQSEVAYYEALGVGRSV